MTKSFYELPDNMKKMLKVLADPKVFGIIQTYQAYLQTVKGYSSFDDLPEDLQKRIAALDFDEMKLAEAGNKAEWLAKVIKKYYQDR